MTGFGLMVGLLAIATAICFKPSDYSLCLDRMNLSLIETEHKMSSVNYKSAKLCLPAVD